MENWRLILNGSEDGAWNMAVDRAVLHARARDEVPPTLRLYRWRVPTVTLGKFQPVDDVDLETCRTHGLDVVRRPTGGRGVLHDDELTYSVVAGVADGLPRGVSASYRVLCGALVEAYQRLGVPASLTGRARGEHAAGACYLHATPADVSYGVAKLSGSAQVWHHDAVLQHGSFVRSRDADLEAGVFRLGREGSSRLSASTATLGGILNSTPSFDEIAKVVVSAFVDTFEIAISVGQLTAEEREDADANRDCFAILEAAR